MAMTNAEKQRAYIARLKAKAAAGADGGAAAQARITALEKEVAALKRQLQAALTAAKTKAASTTGATKPVDEQVARLRKQNAELRARLRATANAPRGTVFMARTDRRKILAALHPDHVADPALRKRAEEAFQIFTNLKIREVEA